jgi:hypothetical protein
VLEKALTFAIDSTARNKGALFMWKLEQYKKEAKENEEKAKKAQQVLF